MPVDTRSKRSSAIFPRSPWRCRFPAPDGTVDAADRRTIALGYAFPTAAPPVVIPIEPEDVTFDVLSQEDVVHLRVSSEDVEYDVLEDLDIEYRRGLPQ